MNTKAFSTEAEASAHAAQHGGTIERNETVSFLLPEAFWEQLRTSPAAFAASIRSHAERCWKGCLKSAWSDATEGGIRGVPASTMLALDDQFRQRVVSVRWLVVQPTVPEVRRELVGDDVSPWGKDQD